MSIHSHKPAADIEAARFVALNADGTVQTAGATIAPYGVNGLKATAGDITDVTTSGSGMVEAGDAISAGNEIKSDANGKAIKCTASEHSFIFAQESAVAGEHLRYTK